jgi:predicted MFS family arabinose efflux permease
MNAIVLTNVVQNLSFVVGPAIAGGLIALVDFDGAFLAQVAILALGLPLLMAMRSPPGKHANRPSVPLRAQLREGLAYVTESSFIRSLFVVTAFTGVFFVGTYQAVAPIFARDVLDVGSSGLGFLNAAFGLGMFAGSLFIASRGDIERKGLVLLMSLLTGSAVFLVFAASPWFALSLASMVAWGFGAAFFMNLTVTMIQLHTPDRLMGRVMSVQALAFFGVFPAGNLLGGALAQLASAQAAVAVGAIAVGLMAAWYLVREPELRAAR